MSLELVALDHSVDAADARAPGPCASAWALGLVHAVIADAVHFAYAAPYQPYLAKSPPPSITSPAMFVGGAAAKILSSIYTTPAHVFLIERKRAEFIVSVGVLDLTDWRAGEAFASQPLKVQPNGPDYRWNWDDIRQKILPSFSTYIPLPGQHHVDPYNPNQGFYGQGWGMHAPLVLTSSTEVAVAAPPTENSLEYGSDLAYVRVKGAFDSLGTATIPARTSDEEEIGLFWAYDGPRLIGTPPRLYNMIIRRIAETDALDTIRLARLLAICNLAMADAGVVAWRAKYEHAVWRPVLGISYTVEPSWKPLGAPRTNDPGLDPNIDVQLRDTAQSLVGADPLVIVQRVLTDLRVLNVVPRFGAATPGADEYGKVAFTPNFPAYPSGHATFGSACFNALKLFRQGLVGNPNAIQIQITSDELNGISVDPVTGNPRDLTPRSFATIDQLIEENNLSRVFLGVHWKFDATNGDAAGAEIASKVVSRAYA